ncbi:MAG TPA: SET domain-containing protein [Nitrososphaera sp.]|nr:SET domain-containing protein [Nitrososphaera sp.]
MLAKLFSVGQTTDRGKGLFAAERVPKGTIVFFECRRCKRIPVNEFNSLVQREKGFILKYGYRKADGSHLLPCDEIIYLNHSCDANILDSGRGYDIVVSDFEEGKEATYDYRQFNDADGQSFSCQCGEKACRRIVRFLHPPPNELADLWKRRINSALTHFTSVKQPLESELQLGIRTDKIEKEKGTSSY